MNSGSSDAIRRLLRSALRPGSVDSASVELLQLAIGHLESRAVKAKPVARLRDAEFRVFSQFGEDGIIQYLISAVPIDDETFVEFGVDDYRESNTRFLLANSNWRGLILDADTSHIDFI